MYKFIQQIINTRQWVDILFGLPIQCTIIDSHSQLSSLLLIKMIGAPHGLQDGLIHPLAKYLSTYLFTSADPAADILYWHL